METLILEQDTLGTLSMNSTYGEWEGGWEGGGGLVQYKWQVSSEYMYVSCLVLIGAGKGVYSHPFNNCSLTIVSYLVSALLLGGSPCH